MMIQKKLAGMRLQRIVDLITTDAKFRLKRIKATLFQCQWWKLWYS